MAEEIDNLDITEEEERAGLRRLFCLISELPIPSDRTRKVGGYIARLEVQLAALGWREITKKDLPEIGQQVLACFKGQFQWVIFPATMTRHEGVFATGHAKPTHWMPMPTPPAPRSKA